MRAAFLFLVIAVALALTAWLLRGSGEPIPHHPPDAGSPSATEVPTAAPGAARAEATRAAAETPVPENLADAPSACLQIVDFKGGAPIAGAMVRRMTDGAVIGFTDERGLAELPLKEHEQLCIGADDYLLRMAPTRLGSTPEAPQILQLVRDQWSVRHRFELRSPEGGVVDEAFVTVRMEGTEQPEVHPDPVVNRARYEHLRIVELEARWNGESIRLRDGDGLRFAVGMPHALEFATAGGLARGLRIEGATTGRTIRVDLEAGDFLEGAIVNDKGKLLGGATVTRQGGDPLDLRCVTHDDGRFAFGPLARGELTLLVRHPDHEPIAFGPIATGSQEIRISLRELPRSTLRGRVRTRPELEPVAGASVSWSATANPPITATTDEDGLFQLAATGEIAGRLLVSAPGCIVLAELVAPGAPFADYDLLPSSTEVRLAKKLTAALAGVVSDASGRPVAGVGVRWIPTEAAAGALIPGRRTISGHVLMLPLSTTTNPDGSFTLEVDRLGTGTLCLAGRDLEAQGIRTEAIAGTTKYGLRLQQP